MFYDYLLNIDSSIYACETKERGMVESMVIKLEDVKKLLSILYHDIDHFKEVDPLVHDYFEK
jgi:hypothetical protein